MTSLWCEPSMDDISKNDTKHINTMCMLYGIYCTEWCHTCTLTIEILYRTGRNLRIADVRGRREKTHDVPWDFTSLKDRNEKTCMGYVIRQPMLLGSRLPTYSVMYPLRLVLKWWRHQLETFTALLALCDGKQGRDTQLDGDSNWLLCKQVSATHFKNGHP